MMPEVQLIGPNDRLVGDSGLDVALETVEQRQWSRVGRGTADGRPVFVKQFIDRTGQAHHVGFAGEQATQASLTDDNALPPGVTHVPLIETVSGRLVTVAPWTSMETWDSLARRPRAERRRHAQFVGAAVGAVLAHRTSAGQTVGWKGLEPKNIGRPLGGEANHCCCAVLFDFGPPQTLPLAEAAARSAAYTLVAPLARRPNPDLMLASGSSVDLALASISELTSSQQVEHELVKLLNHRTSKASLLRPALTLLHRTYQKRAMQTWKRVRSQKFNSQPAKDCSVHRSKIDPSVGVTWEP